MCTLPVAMVMPPVDDHVSGCGWDQDAVFSVNDRTHCGGPGDITSSAACKGYEVIDL
jgi:hypothetical protein